MSNSQLNKTDKGTMSCALKHLNQTPKQNQCIDRIECIFISTITLITLATIVTAIYMINEIWI